MGFDGLQLGLTELRCVLLKVVVFGGGSFGTAMACALARQKGQLNVTLLLRDPYVCKDINERHVNSRYLKVARFHLTYMLAAYPTARSALAAHLPALDKSLTLLKALNWCVACRNTRFQLM